MPKEGIIFLKTLLTSERNDHVAGDKSTLACVQGQMKVINFCTGCANK